MAQKFDMNEKQLAQVRPSVLTAVTLYELDGPAKAIAKQLMVCNASAGNETFSVYYDAAGLTFDDTTVILKDQPIKGKESLFFKNQWWPLDADNSGFGILVSVVDAIVCTLTGAELVEEE